MTESLYIRGADVSAAQSLGSWATIDAWGALWIYLKATAWQRAAGHVVDKMFAAHLVEARRRGKMPGPYHFLDSRADVKAQAEHHWRTVEASRCELRSMIDWEPGETYDAHGKLVERWSEPRLEHAEQWVERYNELAGHLPVVYCGTAYLQEIGALVSPLLGRCPLLVAAYPGGVGSLAEPTTTTSVPAIWQHAGQGWAGWQFDGTTLDRSVATPYGLEQMRVPAVQAVEPPCIPAPDLRADVERTMGEDRDAHREQSEEDDP